MTDDRDWLVELMDAGVLVPTDSVDDNNNRIYRMAPFPPGSEGVRLRSLFDQHVQRRDGPLAR